LDGSLPKMCLAVRPFDQFFFYLQFWSKSDYPSWSSCPFFIKFIKMTKATSYVKLSSAVAAILVGVLKCWTQFWKRTTQESFQQSLVEIGSVECVWRFDPSFNFFFYLQFWSKSDYPSWSSCPFFIKFIKMTKATIVNFFYRSVV
jgi:hypothetical protein